MATARTSSPPRTAAARSFWLAFALLAAACGAHGSTANTISCTESLDDFCAKSSLPCVRHIDPVDVVGSFCDQFGRLIWFSTEDCSDGTVGIVIERSGQPYFVESYRYDGHTGDLIAVLVAVDDLQTGARLGGCVAGPSAFSGATCTDWAVAFGCGPDRADGGADAPPE
jgi:hypothetical protein